MVLHDGGVGFTVCMLCTVYRPIAQSNLSFSHFMAWILHAFLCCHCACKRLDMTQIAAHLYHQQHPNNWAAVYQRTQPKVTCPYL